MVLPDCANNKPSPEAEQVASGTCTSKRLAHDVISIQSPAQFRAKHTLWCVAVSFSFSQCRLKRVQVRSRSSQGQAQVLLGFNVSVCGLLTRELVKAQGHLQHTTRTRRLMYTRRRHAYGSSGMLWWKKQLYPKLRVLNAAIAPFGADGQGLTVSKRLYPVEKTSILYSKQENLPANARVGKPLRAQSTGD